MSVLRDLIHEREKSADYYRTSIIRNNPFLTVAEWLAMIVICFMIYRYYDKILPLLISLNNLLIRTR